MTDNPPMALDELRERKQLLTEIDELERRVIDRGFDLEGLQEHRNLLVWIDGLEPKVLENWTDDDELREHLNMLKEIAQHERTPPQ
jgi:hypothetical protein